ncbi:hypothetical protein MSG28_010634 [Choristoneura fumiferana]|uniref:Uncharacterized protein n=1 Tax=Choristoneura fumiferana TaxID=7141 RepID=A0ACC0KP96_CHOFU|nr:hypothetical protein MSG28_010634 [Choristoneura fumiferana]
MQQIRQQVGLVACYGEPVVVKAEPGSFQLVGRRFPQLQCHRALAAHRGAVHQHRAGRERRQRQTRCCHLGKNGMEPKSNAVLIVISNVADMTTPELT